MDGRRNNKALSLRDHGLDLKMLYLGWLWRLEGAGLTEITGEKIPEHELSSYVTLWKKQAEKCGPREMTIAFASVSNIFPTMNSSVLLGPDTWQVYNKYSVMNKSIHNRFPLPATQTLLWSSLCPVLYREDCLLMPACFSGIISVEVVT